MVMRGLSRRLILCAVVAQLAGVAGASGTVRAGRGGAALAAALVVGAGAARAEGGGAAMAAWTAVIVGAAGVGADQYCGAGYYSYSYYQCRSCPAVSQSHLFAYNMRGDAHTDIHFHTIIGLLLYFDGSHRGHECLPSSS